MAEPRRLALETDRVKNVEKKPVEVPPSLRFNLSLSESNDRTCPELSYPDLVRNALSNNKDKDPYGEEDDHDRLAALARKFEEKYNPGCRLGSKKAKRKKAVKYEDYMDLGMGYDETDSFVDNTEAYDELVPSTLTTQHGGFYINSGELKFRDVNSESENDFQDCLDDEKKKQGRRVKRLAKDNIDKERRRKRLSIGTKDGELLARKRKIELLTKSALKPKKKSQPTVANLIQQREKARQTVTPTAASTSTGPFSNNGSGDNSAPNGQIAHSYLTDDSLSPDGRQNINSGITEAIESVINASLEAAPTEAEAARDGNGGVGSPQSAHKLPSGLPSELEVLVEQIKQVAKESEDGKCKFFSPAVNNMLLIGKSPRMTPVKIEANERIEMQSRELICGQRSSLYAHLGAHLPCSKETLLKRAKGLRLDKEDGKLKEPMRKLKEAIGRVMPQLLDKYNLECQVAVQAGSSIEKETENSNDAEDSDSDEEEKPEKTVDEKNRRIFPRKKFDWNDELRTLLCDVVRIKMKCFELYKSRAQTAEEYLRQFLETEVKELWPKGWIQARTLFKESRIVHAAFTSIFPRPKKLPIVPKKILPSIVPPNVTAPKLIAINPSVTTASTSVPTIISTTATTATTTSALSATNVSPLFILSSASSSSGNPNNFFRSMLTASYATTTISNTSSTTTVTSTVSAISPSMSTSILSSTNTQSTSLLSRNQPILSTTVYASSMAISKNIPSTTSCTPSLKSSPGTPSLKNTSGLLSLVTTSKSLTVTTQTISTPTATPIITSKPCSAPIFTSAVSYPRNTLSSSFATSSVSTPRNSSGTLTSLITSAPKSLLTSEKPVASNTLISSTKAITTTSPSSLEFMSRLMSGVHYHPVSDNFNKLPTTVNIVRFPPTATQSGLPSVSALHQSQPQTSTCHPATTRTTTSPQDKLLKSKSSSQDSLYVKPKVISSSQDHLNKAKISSIPSTATSLLSNMNCYKPEQEKNLTKFLTNKPQQTLSSEGTKLPLQSVRPVSLSDSVPTATSQNYVSSPTSYLSHNSVPSTSSPSQHKLPSHSSPTINLGLSANHATLADLATQAEQAYPSHFQTSPHKTEACQRLSQGQSTQWGSPIYMNKLLVPVTTTLPGYQSLSLPDLTKSSNTNVRPHNSHTILIPSSDAIITGPAPGTFTHGQSFQYRGFAES